MRTSRRSLIKSGAVGAILGSAPALAASPVRLVVYDSRVSESRDFAWRNAATGIDVAVQDSRRWSALRSHRPAGPVEGLTGWSDWVIVRGLLEERGMRVVQQAKANGLFRWTMA